MKNLGRRRESNPGPLASATSALTTELRQPWVRFPATTKIFHFFPLLFSRPLQVRKFLSSLYEGSELDNLCSHFIIFIFFPFLLPSSIPLTCLSLCYCDHITDSGVELLGHVYSLTSLDLSGCSIQDEGIQALRSNPNLRFIMLAELMEITDDGLQVSEAKSCLIRQILESNLFSL